MNDLLYTLFTMTLGGSLAALLFLLLRRLLGQRVKRSALYYLLQRCEFRRCGPHGALISVNGCGFMRMDDCVITDNTCGIMLNSSSRMAARRRTTTLMPTSACAV